MKSSLKYFIVGSSLPICLITLLYNGKAFSDAGRPSDMPYEIIPIFDPLVFGVMNVLMNVLQGGWWIPLVVGALTGMIFSSIGRFKFGLPTRFFKFNAKNEHYVHLYAVILYALIFKFVVQNVNNFMFS